MSPTPRRALAGLCLAATPFLVPGAATGGAFFTSGGGPTYPIGYDGNGTPSLDVEVCLVPSMSGEDRRLAERPLRNAMARWNKGQPTTANLRDNFIAGGIDFESVALHELGHCIGLAHPNLGGNLARPQINATQSSAGPDGRLNLDPGADGVHGSADDPRQDDVNRYLFRRGVNDPFSMPEIVDATTYTTDLAALPNRDLYPANAERRVGELAGLPFTEAAMQHDIFVRQTARTPSHDDVSALRYAESGFDGRQGTADDYDLNLVWGGVSSGCDIQVEFDPNVGLARCAASFSGNGQPGSATLLSGRISFGTRGQFDWFFDDEPPCRAETTLRANEWRQVSLPCEVGVSTLATVRAVFGDDLPTGSYDDTWVLFAYEYTRAANGALRGGYRKLALGDALESGAGYWMISRTDASIGVVGEYHAQIDTPVFAETARGFGWNMIGNPFRYRTAWADARVIAADGTRLDLPAADPGSNVATDTACTRPGGPSGDCTVARFAYRYDAAVDDYDELTPLAGSLDPFDAAWVFAVAPDVEVRVAMPPDERTTP